jgi:iron complex transport system substrate-binding protein
MNRLLPLALALLFCTVARAEIAVRDDTGRDVRLAAPAKRIVSLAPHVTENLFAIGAGDRIVATVDYSDYPADAMKLPRIGGFNQFDLEALLAAKPDLVIAWQSGNPTSQVERLQSLGIPVYVTQPHHVDDVATELERLGILAGKADAGAAAARDYRARLAALRAAYGSQGPIRTFYQVWDRPIMTIGGEQIISDVLRLCGGENVFAGLAGMAPTIGEEAVIGADPEAIVASGMGEARPDWLDHWRRWPNLRAVARGNLFFIPPDLIQRHTPRLLDGAERLCRSLATVRQRR